MNIAFAGFRHSHIFPLYESAKTSDKFNLAGCFEEDEVTRAEIEKNNGIVCNFSSYEEILEDKNIDGEAKQQMIENLSTLKERGISILLDDFGSGYTTFGDLQNLDISIVKIDKAITQNSVTDTGFIILKNIIQTSKDIGFKTLCEGIETKEQEEAAIRAGCDFLQGFYYYRPMSVATLEKILETSGGN